MILLLNAANRDAFPDLLEDMFRIRHEVFVDLKGWEELRRPDGRETDPWDREDAVYLLAVEGGRVLGGARFNGGAGPTLAGEILPELFADAPPVGEDVLEMSRLFARSLETARDRSGAVTGELLAATAELQRIVGGRGALTIMELRLAQALLAWGGHPEPLGLPRRTRDGVLIGVMSHATALASRNLRRARGMKGPAIWWADGPDETPRLYADILRLDPIGPDWAPPEGLTPLERAHLRPEEMAEAYWRTRLR
ncbi:MAG: acyl-homoserine-lactone synthase [Pseudomonadota bacterium]